MLRSLIPTRSYEQSPKELTVAGVISPGLPWVGYIIEGRHGDSPCCCVEFYEPKPRYRRRTSVRRQDAPPVHRFVTAPEPRNMIQPPSSMSPKLGGGNKPCLYPKTFAPCSRLAPPPKLRS